MIDFEKVEDERNPGVNSHDFANKSCLWNIDISLILYEYMKFPNDQTAHNFCENLVVKKGFATCKYFYYKSI